MKASQAFGDYEILDRISVGGMAEVFRARHRTRGTIVALKRMLPEVGEDDEAIEMFEDEARICVRLEHPHIARMLDFGHVGDRFFIAFEHVRGRDLRYVFDRAVRTKDEIPTAFILYVAQRIAEGLAYAHARKDEAGAPVSIVHRDVSPQNIVVSFDGDVKLIDFGIAKGAGRLSRTQAGAIKGKFGYMSPEQVTGREIDPRTDVFSLGICLWELLTRQRLFSGANELIVLEKIKNLAIVAPSEVVPRLPPELDRIVLKALAKDPAERYRAARELYRDLNIFCETHDFVATRAEIAQYMRRTFPEASGRDLAPRSQSSLPQVVRDAAPDTVREPSPLSGSAQACAPEHESSSSNELYGPESDLTAVRRNDEEMMNMAAEKQGGSDLDIFEGLGKKNSAQPSRQSSAPPPPPSSMKTPAAAPSAPPQVVRGDLAVGKKTLLGVQSPVGGAAGGQAGGQSPPPSQRSVPTARASLPAVSAPPQKNSLAQSGSHVVPPAAETKPAAYLEAAAKKADAKAGAAVEMDWDDDEEATHVLDRDEKDQKPASGENLAFAKTALAGGAPAPTPSSSRVPAARVSAPPPLPSSGRTPVAQTAAQPSKPPVPPPSLRPGAATMKPSTGLSAPPPPPPPPSASFRTAPPSPASQGPGSLSRPPVAPPGPISQQAMQGSVSQGMSQMGQAAGSFPPPVMNQGMNQGPQPQNPFQQPIQTHTAPMSMPATTPSGPPRQAYQSVPPPSLPPVQAAPNLGMASRMMEETALVRPQPRTGLWVGLGIGALLLVALVVLLMPHSAKVAINVVDAKGATVNRVDVFVDGKKECETAPCIVDVSAGAHEIKALSGNDSTTKAITVESRKDTTADLVLANGAAAGGTGLKVAGQPGIKLSIDGKEIGSLPQEVKDLTPGDHKIKLSGDRYETLEKNVTIAKDEMQDLGTMTLKVTKGKATISLGTPGARVFIVSGSDRRELPAQFPIGVELDPTKAWNINAQKAGYQDYNQPISFADGVAEKSFDVVLTPKGSAPSTFTPPVSHNSAPATPKTPKTTTSSSDSSSSDSSSGSSATSGGEAFLTMNSLPASAVVLDGKPLGQTPQIKVSVPAGEHTITFINSDQGLKKTMKVTVGAGETKPVIAKLKSE